MVCGISKITGARAPRSLQKLIRAPRNSPEKLFLYYFHEKGLTTTTPGGLKRGVRIWHQLPPSLLDLYMGLGTGSNPWQVPYRHPHGGVGVGAIRRGSSRGAIMRKSLAPNMFRSTLCGPWRNTQRQTLFLSKTLLLKKGVGCTSLRERLLALSARDSKSATQAWSTKRGIGFEQNRHVEKGGGARASETVCEALSAREPKSATQAWPPKGGIGL